MITLPKACQKLITQLNEAGYDAYIVGGCVRDALLSKAPSDWDICTSATPDEMLEVFSAYKVIPTGIAHGTLTVLIDKEAYEVTTYRIDGQYEDHRRPKSVLYTNNLKEDLSRRDFTINAMAYHPKEGLIDYFGGQEDLKNRLLRAVGNPLVRFEEDALRLLRLVRFATVLSFDYEEKTLASVSEKIDLLKFIAKERIQVELNKILLSNEVARGLEDLLSYGFYPYIFPELVKLSGLTQGEGHFLDVFEHSLLSVGLVKKTLPLRLTMLLHDIGKAFVEKSNEAGLFLSHEEESSKLANRLLRDLKYDNKTRKEVVRLIAHHNDILTLDEVSLKSTLRKIGYESTENLIEVKIADIMAHRLSYEKREEIKAYFNEMKALLKKLEASKVPYQLSHLKVSGNDLLSLGLKGEAIRENLEACLDIVILHPDRNDKAYLMAYLKEKNKTVQ